METHWMLWYVSLVRWLFSFPATIDPPPPPPAPSPALECGVLAPATSVPEVVESWSLGDPWICLALAACLALLFLLPLLFEVINEVQVLETEKSALHERLPALASLIKELDLQIAVTSALNSRELQDKVQQISALQDLAESQKKAISDLSQQQQQQQDVATTAQPKPFSGKEFPGAPKRFSSCTDAACDKDYKKIYSDYTVLRSKLQILEHFGDSLKNEIGFMEGHPSTGLHNCETEGEGLRELILGLSGKDCNDKRRRFIEWCCTYDKLIASISKMQFSTCNKRCEKCKKGFVIDDGDSELFSTYDNPASKLHGQEMCRWCISDAAEADKKRAEEAAKKAKKGNMV